MTYLKRFYKLEVLMMTAIKEIKSMDEWKEIYHLSSERKAYILKLNKQCQLCVEAYEEYQKFAASYDKEDADFYLLDVIDFKQISNEIANDLEVTHQSPQLIIVEDQDSVWCDHHQDITFRNMKQCEKMT
ncbi:hypothetical protein BTS2_4068 [Bacillus sp. TS-2]|nr:hypothetical protein BTS2_4068 [Bacillus sp. TS-2]